jgi:hypothetical protein
MNSLAVKRAHADLRWRRALELAAERSTMARLSLAVGKPRGTCAPLGGGARRYACRRRAAAGKVTRYGGGGPTDRPPPEKPCTEGFPARNSRNRHFGGASPRSTISTNPFPSRYPLLDRLPRAVC